MSWSGRPVIDLDAHIVEQADGFYRDYERQRATPLPSPARVSSGRAA